MPNVTAAEKSKSNSGLLGMPLLLLGSFGCGFTLCAVLLIGTVFFFADDQTEQLLTELVLVNLNPPDGPPQIAATTPTDPETVAPPAPPSPIATATPGPTATSTPEPTVTNTSVLPTAVIEPKFGPITFALDATEDDYTPIDPAESFESEVLEIHAIFDYEGMHDQRTWERVWYQDGAELLRSSETWTGFEEGRFDYFIDAGGSPLPAGAWLLELYVDSRLMVTGAFTITALATPTPLPVDTVVIPTPILEEVLASTPLTPSDTLLGSQLYQLLFTKWDGTEHDLYVIDTDGTNEKFLLNRAAGPSWTPDKQQIFFFGEEGVDRQKLDDGREYLFDGVSNGVIAMTNAAGLPDVSNAILFQELTWKRGGARWANVSPNGQMVAFDASLSDNPSYRIYFLGTTTNEQFQYQILGEQGDWSPDSQQIVYRSGRGGITGIWISNRNDTGHRLLTGNSSDAFPVWSPDGQTIAFSRDEGGNVDIYTVSLDGTNLTRLTDTPGPDTLPTYTPDGNIIFRSTRSGAWGIWKMDRVGQGAVQLVANAPVGVDWTYSRMDVR